MSSKYIMGFNAIDLKNYSNEVFRDTDKQTLFNIIFNIDIKIFFCLDL